MKTRRHLAALLSCALAACALHSGSKRPAEPSPPRLATGASEPAGISGQLSLCGLTVVGNVDELHFRMDLAGERVGVRKGNPDYFLVDGLKVSVTTVLADQMTPAAHGLSGIDLLRMHARYECARLADTLGRDVQPEEIAVLTSNNMPAGLAWWLPLAPPAAEEPKEPVEAQPMPAPGGYPAAPPVAAPAVPTSPPAPVAAARSSGIAYMTAAYGHRVLVLSVEGQHDEPQTTLVAKAQAWMGSVVTSPKPISASTIKQDTAAARAAGQSCPGRPAAVWEP